MMWTIDRPKLFDGETSAAFAARLAAYEKLAQEHGERNNRVTLQITSRYRPMSEEEWAPLLKGKKS